LAGDFNDDGVVDGSDFLFWQLNAGKWANPPGSGADGNGNGVVDAADLELWRSQMGGLPRRSGSAAAAFRPSGRAVYEFVGTANHFVEAVLTADLFGAFDGRPARDGFVVEEREPFVFRPERREAPFGAPGVSVARTETLVPELGLSDEDAESLGLVDELFAGWDL
jgi:hypothetical protein